MAVAKLKTIVVAGAAAATMAIGIMPANAVGTWTVTAGSAATGTAVAIKGTTTGASPQIHFTDTTTSTDLTCDSGTASGTTTTGSGLSGIAASPASTARPRPGSTASARWAST